jgi:hypothetical protein
MFTGTAETRRLEEWNVNTIAHHLGAGKALPLSPSRFPALWDGTGGTGEVGGKGLDQLLTPTPPPPPLPPLLSGSFIFLYCYTVILTKSTK